MKQHFCPAEQSMIAFEKECNWCGEQEGSMTQDEIIEMARQAHFDSKTWVDIFADNPTVGDVRNYLIAFAKLIAAKALSEQQRNFCSRCGKRTKDLTHIHTCTPPQGTEPVGDDIASIIACRDMLDAQPVPPRTWVGLTESDRKEIERQSVYVDGAIRMTEAKLKEKNT
jgi:ribosomal protein S14